LIKKHPRSPRAGELGPYRVPSQNLPRNRIATIADRATLLAQRGPGELGPDRVPSQNLPRNRIAAIADPATLLAQ